MNKPATWNLSGTRSVFLSITWLVAGLVSAFAQVEQAWLARYNGPDNGNDSAYSIALDGAGNVYSFGPSGDGSAGGTTNGVSALIKYDNNGNQLWVARDSGAYPNYAIPGLTSGKRSLAVDAAANAYVTGVYWPATNNSPDFVTAKYDPNGQKLWSTYFNGPPDDSSGLPHGYSYDAPSALTIDGAGNVFVTGLSGGYAAAEDFVTIKYDSTGTQRWLRRYNGTANSQDIPVAIVTDVTGNVYVTGWSVGAGTQQDFLTIKYDSNGNSLWTARYDGPFRSVDEAVALAVDAAGNVHVLGRSVGSGDCAGNGDSGCQDITIVKYNTHGNLLWVARHERLGRLEQAMDLAVDSAGNVYVSGSYGAGIIKYDANGNELWASDFSAGNYGSGMAKALALDSAGNAYVTGTAHDGQSWIYMTAKYDLQGHRLWAARYNGPGSWGSQANALALDLAGNIYVTGGSAINDAQFSDDFATLKYSPTNVAGLPEITMPPQSVTVSTGATVTLSVTAAGQPPLHYQWLLNGWTQSALDSPTLSLSNLHVADIADWSVEVSNAVGVVVSPQARVLVNGPPEITFQPYDRSVLEGGYGAVFHMSAIGTPPLTFQWFNEGTPVGVNRNFLELPNVQATNAGTYTVVVTNLYGAVTSAPATLVVQTRRPAIVAPPQSQSISRGESAMFSVTATGQMPLRYQWQFNGLNLPGQTDATLGVSNAQPGDAGDYRAIVANSYGSVTSAVARLTVRGGSSGLSNATPIRIPSYGWANPYPSSIFVSGVPTGVSKVTVTLHGLFHAWAPDVEILLVGPNGQGVVLMSAVGGGSFFSGITLVFDDDADRFLPEQGPIASGIFKPTHRYPGDESFSPPAPPGPYAPTLSAFAGVSPNGLWSLYVVDTESEDAGMISAGWSLDFGTGQPPGDYDSYALNKWHGRYASPTNGLRGVASGPGGFVAVGWSGTILTSTDGVDWTNRVSGTNVALRSVGYGNGTFIAVGDGVVLTSTDGVTWSNRLTGANAWLRDVAYGNGRFVAVGDSGRIRVSSDNGANWQAASSGTNIFLSSVAYGQSRFVTVGSLGIIHASTDGMNWVTVRPAAGTNPPLLSVAYGGGQFVAVGEGRTILTSPDGTSWTRRTAPPVIGAGFYDVIYANGTYVCGGVIGTLLTSSNGIHWVTNVPPTSSYYIYGLAFDGETVVAVGFNSTNPIFQSDPVFLRPPRIVRPPRDTIVRLGGMTNLNVVAVGTSPFTYRWQRNGVSLPGATNQVLLFSNTPVTAEATYTVAVENTLGAVTSSPAFLHVGVPPTVALQPLDQAVAPGGLATFSIEMNGTPPFNYRWRQPGTIYTMLTNLGRQAFFSVPNAGVTHEGIYGVQVSNDFGSVLSRGAQLTILADADADGLPDRWENEHGLNTNDLSDAMLDLDADGATNLEEYNAGTHPTNAASALRIRTALAEGMLSVEFDAESNKTYSVQHTATLDPGAWDKLIDLAARTNHRIETVTGPTGATNRFYRVVTPRQP